MCYLCEGRWWFQCTGCDYTDYMDYVPRCPLSPERPLNLITHSLTHSDTWHLSPTHGCLHYSGVIMSAMAFQISRISIVYSTICSGAETSKLHVAGVLRGIHQWPVNSLHKGPVTQKMFPFDASSCETTKSLSFTSRDLNYQSHPIYLCLFAHSGQTDWLLKHGSNRGE